MFWGVEVVRLRMSLVGLGEFSFYRVCLKILFADLLQRFASQRQSPRLPTPPTMWTLFDHTSCNSNRRYALELSASFSNHSTTITRRSSTSFSLRQPLSRLRRRRIHRSSYSSRSRRKTISKPFFNPRELRSYNKTTDRFQAQMDQHPSPSSVLLPLFRTARSH